MADKKTLNSSLHKARKVKQDEFYTQLPDIEKELKHYRKHFKGKTVLCNCDDPRVSHFFHYFTFNFRRLGLKKLITTCYQNTDACLFSQHDEKRGLYLEYTGPPNPGSPDAVPDPEDVGMRELKGDGDFRSPECVELLKEADIVVTNPPFSLFRAYVQQLVKHGKKFLIIGNENEITYKEIFPLIRANEIWLGNTHPSAFRVPDHYEMRKVRSWRDEDGNNWRSLGNACWFTNLDFSKRHEDLVLFKSFSDQNYEQFDNYDAINTDKTAEIPNDYKGVIGVPITFLKKYNPDQFEIVDADQIRRNNSVPAKPHGELPPK